MYCSKAYMLQMLRFVFFMYLILYFIDIFEYREYQSRSLFIYCGFSCDINRPGKFSRQRLALSVTSVAYVAQSTLRIYCPLD